MSLPFLLEIGVEEVPDWMIRPALENFRELFTQLLAANNLGGAVTRTDATPRRLVLLAEGVRSAQPDENRVVSGPPVKGDAGAAEGFAKKMGVAVSDLRTVQTPKGEYYSFEKHVPGRNSIDILAEALPALIPKIYFPKTMYWTGKGGVRFIRPIRWIVALLGPDVVPFTVAGVHSGNVTSGHRILGQSAINVTSADFEEKLRGNCVILSAAERRSRIEAGLSEDVHRDSALLETLVYLTEYPTPIRGAFSPDYLELPQEILTTVMRHHQRYFSVRGASGKLAPEFVAVMNVDSDPDGLVRAGNERVLRARFNDARFFWDVDLRRDLAERLDDLRSVTFQAKLGSYYEKTQRMIDLARQIAPIAGAGVSLCVRAAELSKCDLTTEMVKEFTELQGVVGGLYARQNGQPSEVWKGVYEHYKPVSMEDSIPSTITGQVLSIVDKADTLRGCFEIGLQPTGSRDPFALRRAAQGIIKILVEAQLPVRLPELTGDDEQLSEFMLDRMRYYFREVRGFNYDEVNAVLAAGSDSPVDVHQRLEALRAVRPTENFERFAKSCKRIRNILRQAQFERNDTSLDSTVSSEPAEQKLLAAVVALRMRRGAVEHLGRLQEIFDYLADVDTFFDKVLVNAPDERIRHNRLLLLSELLIEFSTVADFSEIVVSE